MLAIKLLRNSEQEIAIMVTQQARSKTQKVSEHQQVQSIALDILKSVHKLCKENNLRYFAIGGTAIGAVRHKGFIPWDDDIDIAMPREDYKKFTKLSRQLPSNLEFIDRIYDYDFQGMMGKVQHIGSTMTSQGDAQFGRIQGVAIDIMPLDGTHPAKFRHILHMAKLDVIFRLNSLMMYIRTPNTNRSLRSSIKRIAGRLLSPFLSNEILTRIYIDNVSKYSFDSSKFLARTWLMGTHDGMKNRARYFQKDFAEHIEMPFEDTVILMPKGYDRYLSSLYPNYMVPPPKDKQVPRHGSGLIDLEHSYKYHIAKREGKTIGYTAGCYDMFHIGHLNIIEKAKRYCDYLIVGVNSDESMYAYKNKYPLISESERMRVISALKDVDEVSLVTDTDKIVAYNKHRYDVIFVGDDHKGESKWIKLEKDLKKKGSKVHYFGYTPSTSSTMLRSALEDRITGAK